MFGDAADLRQKAFEMGLQADDLTHQADEKRRANDSLSDRQGAAHNEAEELLVKADDLNRKASEAQMRANELSQEAENMLELYDITYERSDFPSFYG